MKIGVLGCGKMGSVIAKKLPEEAEKILVDRNLDKLEKLNEAIKCEYSTEIKALEKADVVLVILPQSQVDDKVGELCKILKSGSLVLNMSTNGEVDKKIKEEHEDIDIVETKIIAQSLMIDKFDFPSAIVIGSDDEKIVEKIKYVFKNLPYVESGDVAKVSEAVSLATREAIITCMNLKKKLEAIEVEPGWHEALFKCVLSGTIGSFMDDTLGPFARKIVEEIEQSE